MPNMATSATAMAAISKTDVIASDADHGGCQGKGNNITAKRPISRRKFLLHSSGAAGLILAGGAVPAMPATVAAEKQTKSGERSQTPTERARAIPSCAWKRSLGDLPKIALMPEDGVPPQDRAGLNTLARVKKGVPLGGIGAGNFTYNICTFGPWQMKVGRYEERFLPQGAFHIREQVNGKGATARTLATDDVLAAWPRLQPGEAEYHALFPRGWCTYRPFRDQYHSGVFHPDHQRQLPGDVSPRLALSVQDS